jgi:preprotein translocase subunit SecA
MEADDISDAVRAIQAEVVNAVTDEYIPRGSIDEQWDAPGLEQALDREFALQVPVRQWIAEESGLDEDKLREKIVAEARAAYERKTAEIDGRLGPGFMRQLEKSVMLQQLDHNWKEHLAAMDYLRQGIHLRGYAQRNPKQEYKREAFEMFGMLLDQVKRQVISVLCRAQVRSEASIEAERPDERRMQFTHAEAASPIAETAPESVPAVAGARPAVAARTPLPTPVAAGAPFVRGDRKVGRNEPCPCGSGKKFKQCHGRIE